MEKVEIKPGIHWVGGIDWDLRSFHGYLTQRGTTYNAYLIIDDKVVLVDTVKHYLFDEMLSRIREIIDPKKIDYIVSNHVEMDHSGSLPMMKQIAPDAKIITSVQGEKGLKRHFKCDWDLQAVRSGEALNIGKRNLTFVHTPMVHWPDNMVTYCPEDKLLFSNDAFGQHIASTQRFDDGIDWGIIKEEAAKYYANIVLPYGDQVAKALGGVSGLDIEVIAPSHGIIWRSMIPKILKEYGKWCKNETENEAVIVYDTMWDSTKKMAYTLSEGLNEVGVPATMRSLRSNDISDVMKDVLTSKAVLIGSATLNNEMLPTVGKFMTYLKGLRPKNRIGFAFGSYGWAAKKVSEDIEMVMHEMKWVVPFGSSSLNYIPDDQELKEVRQTGKKLGEYILDN